MGSFSSINLLYFYCSVVGISSRSPEKNLEWLIMFVEGTFRECVSTVKYLQITNNMVKWKKKVKKCSVVILYHTRRQGQINITDVDGALYEEELLSISHTLGKHKVLVVLDDLKDCSEFEKERILASQPSLRRLSSHLLLFPKTDKITQATKKKAEFLKVFGKYTATEDFHVNTKMSGFQERGDMFLEPRHNFPWKDEFEQPIETNLKINIFSRAAPSNYEWLVNWLKTTCMVGPDNVHAVYISNNSTKFYTELPNCTFAILYHTLKQGALNITDSSSSLYDVELNELSKFLGKKNVIVVADDLPNTKSTVKKQILMSQPSIGRLARDLFLFNENRNNKENLENLKKVIMQEPESEEFLEPDYPEPNFEESSYASAPYPCEVIYVDVNEDIEPPWRSLTNFSNEYVLFTDPALTWKSSDHLEGLKTGTMYPEPAICPDFTSIATEKVDCRGLRPNFAIFSKEESDEKDKKESRMPPDTIVKPLKDQYKKFWHINHDQEEIQKFEMAIKELKINQRKNDCKERSHNLP